MSSATASVMRRASGGVVRDAVGVCSGRFAPHGRARECRAGEARRNAPRARKLPHDRHPLNAPGATRACERAGHDAPVHAGCYSAAWTAQRLHEGRRMKLSDTAYDTLKRLHSLSGVIPIGAFLLDHLFTNSHAVQGAAAFDSAAAFLAGLPYVVLLEALGIWLPILFPAALGIVIATSSQSNLGRQGYAANWRYTLQRTTGLFLVLFIAYHMWSTRFSAAAMRAPSLYAYMRVHLSHPAIFIFYALGLLAACWHFGNGLFGFAVHWGIATSHSAQRSV